MNTKPCRVEKYIFARELRICFLLLAVEIHGAVEPRDSNVTAAERLDYVNNANCQLRAR